MRPRKQMANRRLEGRVVDENGAGFYGLVVGVFDIGLFGETLLVNEDTAAGDVFYGYGRTRMDGTFSIPYESGTYDLFVRVYDRVRRPVGISGIHHDVDTPLFTIDDVLVMRGHVEGYVAKSGEFTQPVAGNSIEPLIDNYDAWRQIQASVHNARHSIDWMLFFLDVNWVFMTFDPDPPLVGEPTKGGRLENALKAAGERGVKVQLGCNQLVFGRHIKVPVTWPVNTAMQVADMMKSVPNVEVRALRTAVTAPIHAKFVVIDNEHAYVIGSPFVSDYYDQTTHLIEDPRHGNFWAPRLVERWQIIESRQIRVPTHDVSVRLRGPAIEQLNKTFLLHWNAAKPSAPPATAPPAPPPPSGANTTLQVVRSLAGNAKYPGYPYGETAILESYLRAFAQATNYIYLENQYFTNETIADALVLRLKQAPDLRVIFLTNNKVDIPGYSDWQPQTIQRVLDGLTPQERGRIGFFTTWSHEPGATAADKTAICRNYIHSKVAIVDDNWATVGSANLDGASLDYSQNPYRGMQAVWSYLFWLRPEGTRLENRETETNLTVFDGIAGGPASGLAARLRKQLWAEHLGYLTGGVPNASDPALASPTAGNWLALWDERATAKLTKLTQDPIAVHESKILRFPYKDEDPKIPNDADTAKSYLQYAGVRVENLRVWEHYRRFNWSRGEWVDDP
jgi:phosphatidylserine/phosphatidylglycerophosphate/cardiolipin synthase-like enzyme